MFLIKLFLNDMRMSNDHNLDFVHLGWVQVHGSGHENQSGQMANWEWSQLASDNLTSCSYCIGEGYNRKVLSTVCLPGSKSTSSLVSFILAHLWIDHQLGIFSCTDCCHTCQQQQWCQWNLPGFWLKEEWPTATNSPDHNPIENPGVQQAAPIHFNSDADKKFETHMGQHFPISSG